MESYLIGGGFRIYCGLLQHQKNTFHFRLYKIPKQMEEMLLKKEKLAA